VTKQTKRELFYEIVTINTNERTFAVPRFYFYDEENEEHTTTLLDEINLILEHLIVSELINTQQRDDKNFSV